MKKIAIQTIVNACIMFAVMMAFTLVIGYLIAGQSKGLNITASLYIAALCCAALQAFWFLSAVFKKLPYFVRLIGFNACLLPVLALCAWIGAWFPVRSYLSWILFVAIYVIAAVIVTIAYAVYFKTTAGSYDEALARYREKNRK